MSKAARALPVLMYHHVSPAAGLVTVSPENFQAHMQWLTANGWRGVGAEQLAAFIAGEPLPAKSLLITFDDGYLDNWLYAQPALQAAGQQALLFLVSAWPGGGGVRNLADAGAALNHKQCKATIAAGASDAAIIRWSEAQAMQASGAWEIHSHTHTHTRWDQQLPAGSERNAAMAGELQASRQALREHLGGVSRHLCWPQGYYENDYLEVARAHGFDHCYTTEARTVLPGSDAARIGRIVVKDAGANWLARRLAIYASPLLARCYSALKAH